VAPETERRAGGQNMAFKKLTAAALGGLIASFAYAPGAHATGDVWLEGSYEFLDLPDVNFVNEYKGVGLGNLSVREEFVNDDGDFDGFRFDGGIANIPIMGGAYVMGVRGFFAWHDDKSDLECTNSTILPGGFCLATALVNDTTTNSDASSTFGSTNLYETKRDVDHWGAAIDIAQGPSGLRVGPAFRRIDQDTTITGRQINVNGFVDPFQMTYSEDLETNYWGGFVASDLAIDLGGGWALIADGEAGLYWADTDYSGSFVTTNAFPATANANQQLSLDSNELAFIGVLKTSLEKDFGAFKLAGFGRVEYISSAPDMAYNDFDSSNGVVFTQGPDDETRLGERYAYTASVGARVTVPMGGGQ
jgi:hypothetical protein